MFSIHTHVFNVQKAGFDWKGAFSNWLEFLNGRGQLVIAVNTSEDDSPKLIRDWIAVYQGTHGTDTKVDVIDIAIPYTEADFDGRGKAAALAACTEPYCILLDLDERVVPSMRRHWAGLASELERSPLEGFLIPSIDLIGDAKHYRCGGQALGAKWYLHKNLPHLTRGVVKWARREDGSIDKTKSDTCELIHKETGELARCAPIVQAEFPHYMLIGQLESGAVPFVYHLGSLDLEQRVRQSAFWRGIWDMRDQHSQEPVTLLSDLEAIPRYRHNLPHWKERL